MWSPEESGVEQGKVLCVKAWRGFYLALCKRVWGLFPIVMSRAVLGKMLQHLLPLAWLMGWQPQLPQCCHGD